MEKKINYCIEPDALCLDSLADAIFNGSWLLHLETGTSSQIHLPHYLGYFKSMPLEFYVSRHNSSEVFFGCGNWCDDEDLKKALVVFYMKRGIYPILRKVHGVSSLIMQLEKL